ncbi:MAG: hypothetical protein CW338_09995, partial [Clostridiales bacterium]|nr:hypothetical protein [Clostridiales bacterium]
MAARHPGKGSLPEKGAVKSISAGKGLLPVLLIAAAVFAVRFVCALFLRTGPNVLIDENLYTSIAKSFSTDLSVFYRGHPVDYPYLLYPAVLSPVYILNRLIGGDIYRWVQAFNCLMMACSVIPAYMFSREFSGDRRKALTVSALYAQMPDGFYSGFLMTESLLWLLSACLILCAFRAFRAVVRQEKAAGRYAVLTAVLTFLMFITKPGAIAMG